MIIKSVTFDRANRKADKSISISFTTALEQSSDELKEFDDSLGSCILAIKTNESEFELEDLTRLDSIDIDIPEKSPSQRLKNVLYCLQKQELERKPERAEESEYYRLKMNQIIEHYKKHLN